MSKPRHVRTGRVAFCGEVGQTEIWRSLKTTKRRTANARIVVAFEELEREWGRLAADDSARDPYPDPRRSHRRT